ncbi:hypothetical protein [Methanoculleus chikugoensis]|uniref:hypothetical protein n=1 Tax=Methanoculleus chikugoensis TaxID=118126 RepID=UPI000A7CB123|nr:hypothetical protein [Methanoculleus chikugoensis]
MNPVVAGGPGLVFLVAYAASDRGSLSGPAPVGWRGRSSTPALFRLMAPEG